MVIVQLSGGLGNQLFQYAAGRRLAHKWNTELKMDLTFYSKHDEFGRYLLDLFNVKEAFATSEDLDKLSKIAPNNSLGIERSSQIYMPEILNCPDNVYLHGCWENERYFTDISDIIRQEFTLKNPLGATAQRWKEKIISAECSVSLHVRHGDFVYISEDIFAILPLSYYHECINRLKQNYKNITLFVFSNNLKWVKDNLHTDVPMEFVEGKDLWATKLFIKI